MLALIMVIENADDRNLAEKLYHEYSQPMYRIAYSILKDQTKAEDAVSDAFVKIIRYIDKLRALPCNKTRGFIAICIRRVCFNLLKRERLIDSQELDDDQASEDMQTEDLIISIEDYEKLCDYISSMDHKYRDVLRLKYFLGFSDDEIAGILDISPQNVRIRLHRARMQLKQYLKAGELNEACYLK